MFGSTACSATRESPAGPTVEINGAVTGTVRYSGRVPKSDKTDNEGRHRDLLSVQRPGDGLRHAVVFLRPLAPSAQETREAIDEVVVDQFDLSFVPHVLIVRPDQAVYFTNSDPENHNVRAQALEPRNLFNIVTAPGNENEKHFRREPEDKPIQLSCDVHGWMSGWIYVSEAPYFAVTDAQGHFSIQGVPAGSYTIEVLQPDAQFRAEGQIAVQAGQDVSVNVAFTQRHLGSRETLLIEQPAPNAQ